MTLHPQAIKPVPVETTRVAKAAFPKGNLFMSLRDELGTIYKDEDFIDLYVQDGQPALAPWRLALVCVMQYISGLSDRQAAEAVRSRLDWKYALSLELTDPGFDFTVLSEFRQRLIQEGAERLLFNKLLANCQEKGWLKERGQQRTDSTHVLAAVRHLSRLETVGETLRAALNALAVVAPDWLRQQADPDWFERYSFRMSDYRFPKGQEARREYALTVGKDGWQLLSAIYDHPETRPWLRQIEAVEIFRQTWLEQYWVDNGRLRWREEKDLPPVGRRRTSPYDEEARYGNKGSTTWFGYKVHLSETCGEREVHLITNVETTLASVTDNEQTSEIHQSLAGQNLLPSEHLVDSGYVDSDLLVSSAQDYQVELVGPVRPNVSWQAKTEGAYDQAQFQIDWPAQQVTCPQGKLSSSWTYVVSRPGYAAVNVGFSRGDCSDCPVRSLCVRSPQAARRLSLRVSEEYLALQKARQEQQTPEWKQRYQRRVGIEGTISSRSAGLRAAASSLSRLAKNSLTTSAYRHRD